MLREGFILHAPRSLGRAAEDFTVARPNAWRDPQCVVAPWTHAGGGHLSVQHWYLHFAHLGEKPLKGRSLIQLSEVNVWTTWKLMWKSFGCFDLSRSAFTMSVCLSDPPFPIKTKKRTRTNYLNDILEKKKFDYIVSFSSSWLCLTPTSFALSEKVKHQVWLIYCSPGKKTMIASELWLSLL